MRENEALEPYFDHSKKLRNQRKACVRGLARVTNAQAKQLNFKREMLTFGKTKQRHHQLHPFRKQCEKPFYRSTKKQRVYLNFSCTQKKEGVRNLSADMKSGVFFVAGKKLPHEIKQHECFSLLF